MPLARTSATARSSCLLPFSSEISVFVPYSSTTPRYKVAEFLCCCLRVLKQNMKSKQFLGPTPRRRLVEDDLALPPGDRLKSSEIRTKASCLNWWMFSSVAAIIETSLRPCSYHCQHQEEAHSRPDSLLDLWRGLDAPLLHSLLWPSQDLGKSTTACVALPFTSPGRPEAANVA